jgi:hypothetical protein
MVLVGLLIVVAVAMEAGLTIHASERICRPPPPRTESNKKACLVIGDSVSIGYTPMVTNMTAGLCDVVHAPFSGDGGACDSSYALKCLPLWLNSTLEGDVPTYDAVIYNFGLHDTNDKQDDVEARDEFVPLDKVSELEPELRCSTPNSSFAFLPVREQSCCYSRRHQEVPTKCPDWLPADDTDAFSFGVSYASTRTRFWRRFRTL